MERMEFGEGKIPETAYISALLKLADSLGKNYEATQKKYWLFPYNDQYICFILAELYEKTF